MENSWFDIIYEDNFILVVHKEGGIPVQTIRTGQKDMMSLLKNYRVQKGEEPYIGMVHRLDQPVEGVMVFAKTKEAAAQISRQVAQHQTEKYYQALLYLPEGMQANLNETYTLTDCLYRDGRNNCSSVVQKGTPKAKKAVLTYRFLQQNQRFAKVQIKLETGRHHQIRVQFSHAGYPLVGDRKYGGKEAIEAAGDCNVALCSTCFCFTHPCTLKKEKFTTQPKNPIFDKLLERG